MSMSMDLTNTGDDNISQQQQQKKSNTNFQAAPSASMSRGPGDRGVVPPPPPPPSGTGAIGGSPQQDVYQRIKWNGWGTKNKWMRIDPNDPMVVLHANGKPIRGLVPFAHSQIQGGVGPVKPLDNTPSIPLEEAIAKLPKVVINEPFLAALREAYYSNSSSSNTAGYAAKGTSAAATAAAALVDSQIKTDPESRLCHIFGKNYRDLWRARKGIFDRAPDAVVLPHSHDDCVKLMACAHAHNVIVIPYGGGTNVTGGIEASPFETRRMIVSVDMRRMNKMLSIDKVSRIAVFEAGVLGPDLDEAIGRHGFMFGHDPDSYIHSTLGGWVASRSSGALSNKYGDIEQMVLSLKIVTPTGVIETPVTSRPCGPDLNGLFIGSEGHFGIITECCVKVEPIPPVRQYEGWLFPSFVAGYEAFYKCTRMGIHPTCMRLYDEDDTQMSFALKSDGPVVAHLVGKAIKQYLAQVKAWDMSKVCLVILGHEGCADQVKLEHAKTSAVFLEFGGFRIGKGAGQNWQEKKYDLPFVRDFALSHKLWADVFETSVLYSEAVNVWKAVKNAVRSVWREEGKKGWIGCHACHQYRFGCCLYFTYAGQQHDDRDFETFLKVKTAATEAMLKYRGNLSHHHGIGYEHIPWIERYLGTPAMDLLLQMKTIMDPQDICNPHKLLPVAKKAHETPEELAERRRRLMMFYHCGLPKDKQQQLQQKQQLQQQQQANPTAQAVSSTTNVVSLGLSDSKL